MSPTPSEPRSQLEPVLREDRATARAGPECLGQLLGERVWDPHQCRWSPSLWPEGLPPCPRDPAAPQLSARTGQPPEGMRPGGQGWGGGVEAGSSPVSMESVVVFPAPLWPSKTVIWPSYRFRFRSLTAALPLFPTLNTCGRGRAGPGHQEPPRPSLQRPSVLLPRESPSTRGCWEEMTPSAPGGWSPDGRLPLPAAPHPSLPRPPAPGVSAGPEGLEDPGIAHSEPRECPLPSWSEVKGGQQRVLTLSSASTLGPGAEPGWPGAWGSRSEGSPRNPGEARPGGWSLPCDPAV